MSGLVVRVPCAKPASDVKSVAAHPTHANTSSQVRTTRAKTPPQAKTPARAPVAKPKCSVDGCKRGCDLSGRCKRHSKPVNGG